MTLAECSRLVGASPKWVLNTLKSLRIEPRYSVDLSRRLTLARVLYETASIPMSKSMELVRHLLRTPYSATSPAEVRLSADGDVVLKVDVYRLLSSFHVRLAELHESYAPRTRGRPRTRPSTAVAKALDWGLALSLIHDNLRKSPAQRIRQLDAMNHFSRSVSRPTGRPRHS